MSVPAYPAYKESGVPWLGAVPSHWSICSLKRVVSLRSGEAITSDSIEVDGDYPVFGGNGHRGYASSYTHEGDFALIGRQGALCGNVNYANGQFWASEHAIVVAPIKPLETRWLGELLRSMNLNQYSVAAAQPGLSADALGNLRIPFPPSDEQTAIATFLDRETAKIDGLVAEQERLIGLLKEKRQAVISHAVTKGLNPNAPMKDSGIEWLGAVPAHWEIKPLKNLTKSNTTITYGIVQAGPDIEGGIPYIRTSDMSGDELPEHGYLRTSVEIDESYARSRVFPGDLVIAIRATIGKPLIVPTFLSGANLTQGTAKFSPSDAVGVRFAQLVLGSAGATTEFDRISKGSTFKEITLEMLRNFRIPVPPVDEQAAIAAQSDQFISTFNALSAAAVEAKELLKERRAALISAAVTGKIDVRAAVSASELETA